MLPSSKSLKISYILLNNTPSLRKNHNPKAKMAKHLFVTSRAFKATIHLLLLAITLSCANSARILDEVDPQDLAVADPTATTTVPTTSTFPSGQIPTTASAINPSATVDDDADPPITETEVPATVSAPVADVDEPIDDVAPVTPPVIATAPILGATATSSPSGPATTATVAQPAGSQTTTTSSTALSFFMHNILGGSNPSSRVVTGIIARTDINGIPFSVPNNNFFPLQGGTPLLNINNLNNLINPNTAPFISSLNGGQTSTVLQNANNNNNVVNGNNQPFVTAGQLPAGITLQKLMFGSITVVDNELTEGHELGSAVVGKAQGIYLASSLDGTSHTIAFTVLLHGGDHHDVIEDTISFFGVHRTATVESQIAVIGGTGKYENAKGYATIEAIRQEDQHTTDGVDTVMHFNVYLSE